MSDHDGRHQYVRPAGIPKPPPELWAELEAAGRAAGFGFETDPRWLIAKSRYKAWLEDHGIHESAHGSEAPPPDVAEFEDEGIF